MEDTGNQTQTPIETPVVTETPNEPVIPTNEPPATPPADESFLEIKYNKENVKLDREKAAELAQKGMNYDKAIERARQEAAQEARDAYFAEQNIEWQGKKITTESEYKQALKEKELIDKYSEQGLPDDVVQELVDGKKFRDEYQETQKQTAERTRQETEYKAFLDAYPDVDPKDIPQSVWDDVGKGKNLVDAFLRHENMTLKQQLAAAEQTKQIEQQNQTNAASSTGSVTGNGSSAPAFFTQEQVSKMSNSEVNKNWNAINESMKKW